MSSPAIQSKQEHQTAMARLDVLMDLDPEEGSDEANELQALAARIEEYEKEKFPIMSKIESKVCEKIQERAELGLSKYGVTMERKDLSMLEWLKHAQQEAMDLAVYLEKAIEEEEG